MDNIRYFISDAHLRPLTCPDERRKQEHLRDFLGYVADSGSHLYILGDLFHFWFEYGSVVPRVGGRVLSALADLVDAGIEVTVFAGNHDWWIGEVLEQEYGVCVHHGPMWLSAQNQRIYLSHGDGDDYHNPSYMWVKRVLHSQLAIRAFRWIHPDVGAFASRLVNRHSHIDTETMSPEKLISPAYAEIAAKVFSEGADCAIFGHVHASRVDRYTDGTVYVLGDWVSQGTYTELADGHLVLRAWRGTELKMWP
jgi:UDP-2,3-diacylglucosamine hydrolase